MVMSFVKTGSLVEKKFREFFIPTVLASMAAQLGTIVNGIILGNFINANAMAAIFVPNTYEISKILTSVEELRILMYEYLLILVWRCPLFLMSFT